MSENELDILAIDAKIKSIFEMERKNLQSYKNRLQEMNTTIKYEIPIRVKNDLEKSIRELEEKINSIENRTEENFYVIETTPCIEEYKQILFTPLEVNFMGRVIKSNPKKQEVINRYIIIVQKYHKIDLERKDKKGKMFCDGCQNKKNFDILDETVYVCRDCGIEQQVLPQTVSYTDIDRVNISTKYSYDRKVHFRDCMNQYQGKQNCTIDPKVYDALENQFQCHHLLVGDKNTPRDVRFSKITKDHIAMFLKELGMSKHYENINLIYYNLTGIKPDDISHLEDKLMADFDVLAAAYDKLFKHKIDRTSFINTQYVLYQLLQRHKHPCKKEDFVMLKTVDRQTFHDTITTELFSHLGWNVNSLF